MYTWNLKGMMRKDGKVPWMISFMPRDCLFHPFFRAKPSPPWLYVCMCLCVCVCVGVCLSVSAAWLSHLGPRQKVDGCFP